MTDGADCVHDSHQAATDSAEDALDLWWQVLGKTRRWIECITYARDNGTHIEELWFVSRRIYFGLDVRVDSELEVACVWTVGSLNGCILKELGRHEDI